MGFFLPREFKGRYGDDMDYIPVKKIDRYFFSLPQKVNLFHASRQRCPFIPFSKQVKVLMTVHDLNYLYSKAPYKAVKYHSFYQRSINKADRIVAISKFAQRDILEHLDVKGKKVDVIYNGLYEFKGTPVPPEVKPSGKFVFTVGTVIDKKNFHVLPPILQGNDFELIIAGLICKQEYADQIMEEARKWGVADRVHIVGPVSEEVKYWYLQNCSAFCFPSIAEGFAMPILEAMYYGKPVFVSNHTCIPEIAGDCAFYFNHEFDRREMQDEFARGMDAFGKEMDPAKVIARAKSFTWARTARQYFDVYKDMLQE
ncbi:MAG: glycosyltransferase family 4 protein [Bacteroidales bacterium]|nr:glycosyltransferase family 4 protein [Bacteroidales bacterium]